MASIAPIRSFPLASPSSAPISSLLTRASTSFAQASFFFPSSSSSSSSSSPAPPPSLSSSSTLTSSSSSETALTQPSWPSFLPSLPSISSLLELFPPILLAVPKHKVTHSRKSMRSANKGLKNKTNLTHCEACGTLKLAHNLCPTCFSQISRRWKKEARDEIPISSSQPPSNSV